MKGFRKSTRIAYWVLRTLAISSALLLFSVTGIMALQTATYASSVANPLVTATATSIIMRSPLDDTPPPPTPPTPTPAPPIPSPTATPIPTVKLPQPTLPPPTATKPVVPPPTSIPTVKVPIPIVNPTPTNAAIAPGGAALPPPTPKGKPTPMPSPTPHGSPTPTPMGTQVPTNLSNGTGSSPTKTQSSDGNNGMMASLKSLIGPIAGVSTTILLASASVLGLMFWRKRTALQAAVALSGSQTPISWAAQQPGNYAQPTQVSPVQNQMILPFEMQSIAQYSPLLGAPDTSMADAPVRPRASDLRPLSIDYPQILEVHTDKTAVPTTPATLPSFSTAGTELQPALQLADTQFSPLPAHVSPTSSESMPPKAPVAYHFPQPDVLLENLMHQAQMGLFSLPGKEVQG